MVGLKGETNINGEIKKLRHEIAEIKRYLNRLIELNMIQIKEELPADDEVRLLRKRTSFKKEEYVDWDKVKNWVKKESKLITDDSYQNSPPFPRTVSFNKENFLPGS